MRFTFSPMDPIKPVRRERARLALAPARLRLVESPARTDSAQVHTMRTDEDLAQHVYEALVRDERVSALPIRVLVEAGIVTLRGTVQASRRKLAAQEIAAACSGCRGVRNELVVEPPGTPSDEEIAAAVRRALEAQADIQKDVITLDVHSGLVTLRGSVRTARERTLAADVARAARGVVDVHDLLLVDPVTLAQDSEASQEIRAALASSSGLEGASILVAIGPSAIVLSGEVREPGQRELAETVVRQFRPIHIRNDIVVRRA